MASRWPLCTASYRAVTALSDDAPMAREETGEAAVSRGCHAAPERLAVQ